MKTHSTCRQRHWKHHRRVAFLVGLCTTWFSARPTLADQIWAQFYDGFGGDNQPYAVVVDSAGNAIVTGSSKNQNGNDDFYTAKYSASSGALLWAVRHSGQYGGDARGTGISVDSQDNVVVTGYSFDPAVSADPNNPGFDFYTVKYAAGTGTMLWEHLGPTTPCMPGCMEPNYQVKKVAVDANGNVAITGVANYVGSPYNGWRSFYTAKLSGFNGHALWEKYYAGPGVFGPDADRPIALAVDTAGNVIVIGSSPCCPTYTGHKDL